MPSLTDDLAANTPQAIAKMLEGIDKGAKATRESIKATGSGIKGGGKVFKGLCLIMGKGVKFTTRNVMQAVNEKALKRTGDIKYSKRNISIEELSKRGTVRKVDAAVTGDVMRHFDAACKKAGVKYSAMKDEGDPQKPQYYIFYEGKTTEAILQVMQQAYNGYVNEQEKGKGKDTDKSHESIRAKLAFFRDRVAARDREQDAVEKHHAHSEPQR